MENKLTDELLHRYTLGFLEVRITELCKRTAECRGVLDAAPVDELLELLLQRKDLLDRKKSNTQGTATEIAESMKKLMSTAVLLRIRQSLMPDPKPVWHGRWIDAREHCGAFVCSGCEHQSVSLYGYCPSCGAKMDGGENDNEQSP